MKTPICQLMLVLTLAATASSIEYFVDFENGSDQNTGLSQAQAWKHAPGDPQAEGIARSMQLRPGDRLQFRGGVVYRGTVSVASGTHAEQVVYSGDAWGDYKAIIDGSEPFSPAWALCNCSGHPHNGRIYVAGVPPEFSVSTGLYENGSFMWLSQDPNPSDHFFWDHFKEYNVIPHRSSTIRQSRTTITDPTYFTQSDPQYWDGAYVAAWRVPNVVVTKRILSFDPGSHTITHEDLGNDIYDDRDSYYALLNHLDLVDLPGEYYLDEADNLIYLYPRGDITANQYSIQERGTAIRIDNQHDFVIEGFIIQGSQLGISTGGNKGGAGSTIRNNHIRNLRSNGWYSLQVNGDNILIEGNRVINNQRSVGILAGGRNITVRNNHVEKCSRQGIWFMGARDSAIVNNTVRGPGGAHANGISVYSGSQNTLVANNRVHDISSAITFEEGDGFIFWNNIVFDGGAVNSWGGSSNAVFANNIFSGPANTAGTTVFVNNIVNGGGSGDLRSHNIYTKLMWSQEARYGWSLQEGELYEEETTRIFSGAYGSLLFNSSLAVDAGIDARPHLSFTGFDFERDINGNPRSGVWDIGAYEYGLAGACEAIHPADNEPCDDCISNSELMAYLQLWKTTDIPINSLIGAVRIWKEGCG